MQSQILPSRAALVDRIALQFEYGQNLIVLLGTSGLGKSYMLETFITDKYNDFNKSFVQVSAQMTDAELMSTLLEQTFNAPLIDHNLSLSENVYQLLQQQQCGPSLWVLDGGKHLSEEILAELELLAKSSPSTLYIMLASQSKLPLNNAIDIYLEPLSVRESKQLMSGYFTNLPYDEDPVFQAFLTEARGNPSLLLAWQFDEHAVDIIVKDNVSWRLHLLVLMLIIMFLIIGFLYKSDMTQWWQQYYQQAEPEVLTTAIAVKQLNDSSSIANEPNDTAVELFTAVNEVELKSHQNDVPAIMQSLSVANEPIVPKEITKAVITNTAPVVANKAIADALTQVNNTNTQGSAWYIQQPESNIVIQLLAVTQQQVSEEFITQYQLQDIAHTYQTKRNDKIWWVVSCGNFTDLKEAKLAMKTLPAGVLKNKPFYKKISKIKQEIARLDQ